MSEFMTAFKEFTYLFPFDAGFNEFCQQLKSGRLSHAYILECADKILYKDLLLSCAVEIMGDADASDANLVFARTHPDVEFFPAEDKKRISVDDIKRITSSAYVKPSRADKKVFCLSAGGVGMEVWQNKLLKLLEEPPPNVFFLIAVPDEELLATVRSRCQVIKTGRIDKTAIADFLNKKRNVPKEKAFLSANLADGSVEKAIKIASSEEYATCVRDVLNLFCNMTNTRNMIHVLPIVAKYKDDYEDFLEIIEKVLFEVLITLNLFEKTAIMKIAGLYTPDALMRSVVLVEQAKKQLDSNANYTMVMDGLLLKILEVRYLCRQ